MPTLEFSVSGEQQSFVGLSLQTSHLRIKLCFFQLRIMKMAFATGLILTVRNFYFTEFHLKMFEWFLYHLTKLAIITRLLKEKNCLFCLKSRNIDELNKEDHKTATSSSGWQFFSLSRHRDPEPWIVFTEIKSATLLIKHKKICLGLFITLTLLSTVTTETNPIQFSFCLGLYLYLFEKALKALFYI